MNIISNVSCFIDITSIEFDVIKHSLELILLRQKHAHRGGELVNATREATRLSWACTRLSQVKALF